eukprot:GDKJ01030654.1.p1 GENE.GDKJ01030654.1~~GDKJ01030654.1.p1  ORF type:complete len:256 (-),score=32.60 GDKJ01030654.1:67-726(-)
MSYAIRRHLDHYDDHVLLSLDTRNAFNCISRKKIEETMENFTVLRPFINKTLLSDDFPKLLFDENQLSSEEGVMQGNPLSMLLFCAAIAPIYSKINDFLGEKMNSQKNFQSVYAYADDCAIILHPDHISALLSHLLSWLQSVGLDLQLTKCKIYAGNDLPSFACIPSKIPVTSVWNALTEKSPLTLRCSSDLSIFLKSFGTGRLLESTAQGISYRIKTT